MNLQSTTNGFLFNVFLLDHKPTMKDVINKKIKHDEYAAVCVES